LVRIFSKFREISQFASKENVKTLK